MKNCRKYQTSVRIRATPVAIFRRKYRTSPLGPGVFVASSEAMGALDDEEMVEVLRRHWEGDPGENPEGPDPELGFESHFTIRDARVIVFTDSDGVQTNVWLRGNGS